MLQYTIPAGIALVVIGAWITWLRTGDGADMWMAIAILSCVAGLGVAIPEAALAQHDWEHWCKDQGGHVTDHTDTTVVTTINPGNGQPGVGVGSSTTYYCLTTDGRILDIK